MGRNVSCHAGSDRAEEALRESEERFRFLVEGVRDYATFALDPEGRVVSWNAGAERLNDYPAEEVVGRHFSCYYPPEDIEAGKPERTLQMAVAEGHSEDDGRRMRKDGSRFWADVVITALMDAVGWRAVSPTTSTTFWAPSPAMLTCCSIGSAWTRWRAVACRRSSRPASGRQT